MVLGTNISIATLDPDWKTISAVALLRSQSYGCQEYRPRYATSWPQIVNP
jgi:hypothetical protein